MSEIRRFDQNKNILGSVSEGARTNCRWIGWVSEQGERWGSRALCRPLPAARRAVHHLQSPSRNREAVQRERKKK